MSNRWPEVVLDERCRDLVAEHEQSIRQYIRKRWLRRVTDSWLEDMEQFAMLYVCRAAHRFDPAYGASFVTYAIHVADGAIAHWFRDQASVIHHRRARLDHPRAEIVPLDEERLADDGEGDMVCELDLAMSTRPARDRHIYEHLLKRGESQVRVAADLGRSQNWVSLRARAIKQYLQGLFPERAVG